MINLSFEEKRQLSNILEKLASAIDLTDSQYELAIERYKSVGEWLAAPDSILKPYNPIIHSQGSFRLGTTVRPINEDDEFDVDLTCRLQFSLPGVQKEMKNKVGERLRDHKTYTGMLKEMQRCWRLKYAESARFHLDIVPAVGDQFDWIIAQNVPRQIAQHAICITDNERYDYDLYSREWPKSNPEGYAIWFLEVMKVQAEQIRMQLKSQLSLERVEDVPDYKVRTPLQQGVQLMKRHRDIMFGKDENKPISIIITTLAAHSYAHVLRNSNTNEFYDIIVRMIDIMPMFIENRGGVKWVTNPVQPSENFADKWQIKKVREENFYKWHSALKASLVNDAFKKGMPALSRSLQESFGMRAINETLNNIGRNTKELRERGDLKISATGILGSVGTVIKNHNFYGNG